MPGKLKLKCMWKTSLGIDMKAKITWINGRAFLGESGSGHAVVMDGAPEAGGRNIGVRPMEMMLLGLGGCTAFDVVMILEKSREKVTGCEVVLESERASEDPKVFTAVKMIYTLRGEKLKPASVERAIKLSAEKYCSASKMFEKTAVITHEWTVVDTTAA
jgi:putative redox protein